MRYDMPALDVLPELPFDTVIDVRSPAEYAEDHMPGAINLPVLSNEERARVGTIYVQESPFLARKVGGALVAQNIARHLQGPLFDKDGSWQSLLYCWRGGQRSGAFGLWLREVGWRVKVLNGGYQSYRRAVVRHLYDLPLHLRLLLLDGNTGTAKTELLHLVAERGGQILDLEGLANHRGSVLGIRPGGQPDQKMFESRISAALSGFDPALPVLVEAESSKVGQLIVPPALWKAMRTAPRIQVRASPEDRTAYLCRAYSDLFADLPVFEERLGMLTRLQGKARIEAWKALARQGEFVPLVRELIDVHYDGRYRKSRATGPAPLDVLDIRLDDTGLQQAADQIAARLVTV